MKCEALCGDDSLKTWFCFEPQASARARRDEFDHDEHFGENSRILDDEESDDNEEPEAEHDEDDDENEESDKEMEEVSKNYCQSPMHKKKVLYSILLHEFTVWYS